MSLDIVILAAGQGKRMESDLPKVLNLLGGKTILEHVIDTARKLNPKKIYLVMGYKYELIKSRLVFSNLDIILQEKQLGTGHAITQVLPFLKSKHTLILYGDVPLIEAATIERLIRKTKEKEIGILTTQLINPQGYGRIKRNSSNKVYAIVEHKDADENTLRITECNTGILLLENRSLNDYSHGLLNNNIQKEYYLTDLIQILVNNGFQVTTEQPNDSMEVQGVNDQRQLADLERYYQYREANRWMSKGVTLRDPKRFDIRGEVEIGKNVIIDINVILEGRVIISDNVSIEPNCIIRDSTLHKGVVLKANSHLDNVVMGTNSTAGPFARLRKNTILAEESSVGNFVELKSTYLGKRTKCGHLSYLGDTTVGSKSNIGAGTITCNYDGTHKWKTVLGENVFIGSNNSLVAPVTIFDGATSAAGSTITQDIPEKQLAISRARQRNVINWKRPGKK